MGTLFLPRKTEYKLTYEGHPGPGYCPYLVLGPREEKQNGMFYVDGFLRGASDIMKEQSPKKLLFQVRGKLYKLLSNCIPPEVIFKRLLYELLKKLDAELKHDSAIGLHIIF
ncbi:hypothetical protein Droror1_Dr00010580 [Drosera rotundifolia]